MTVFRAFIVGLAVSFVAPSPLSAQASLALSGRIAAHGVPRYRVAAIKVGPQLDGWVETFGGDLVDIELATRGLKTSVPDLRVTASVRAKPEQSSLVPTIGVLTAAGIDGESFRGMGKRERQATLRRAVQWTLHSERTAAGIAVAQSQNLSKGASEDEFTRHLARLHRHRTRNRKDWLDNTTAKVVDAEYRRLAGFLPAEDRGRILRKARRMAYYLLNQDAVAASIPVTENDGTNPTHFRAVVGIPTPD